MKFRYWEALKIKWFTLGALVSFTTSSFWVFSISQTSPVAAQFALVLVFTGIGFCIFREWYMMPPNTYWGKKLDKIFELSYQRTKHLPAEQALFDVTALAVSLFAIFLLGITAWIFPEYAFWFKWLITLISGLMGTYFFNEEVKAPSGFKQRFNYIFSLLIFVVTVIFMYFLSFRGIEYSTDFHEFPIFIVSVGAWFATGLIGATLRAAYQCWRDRFTEPKNQRQAEA